MAIFGHAMSPSAFVDIYTSTSTTLQWYIYQHDYGIFYHGIDSMVNCSPMRYFEKDLSTSSWWLIYYKKTRVNFFCVGIFLTPFVGINFRASFYIFVLWKRALYELQSSDQGIPVFYSTKYYNWYHYMHTVSLPSYSDILTACSSYQEATPV